MDEMSEDERHGQRLARYECLVHAVNRHSEYGTPVSVLATSARKARERAIAVGWEGDSRDARVTVLSITDAPSELVLCRACHFGHFNECEDERCQSMRLEDRHE